jgi:prolyl oligopeptidase
MDIHKPKPVRSLRELLNYLMRIEIRGTMRGWLLGVTMLAAGAAVAAEVDNDPYLWLSEIHGSRALAWAKTETDKSNVLLKADPTYRRTHDAILAQLDVKDRIPVAVLDHGDAYNFWQDAAHVRGLWRRTSIADYARKEPTWETLLDLDALDASEKANWVWQGADCAPGGDLCLLKLSPGGGDAATVREFSLKNKAFVEGGFRLAESKLTATYLDREHVLVATDFGPGSMTRSSYPRIVKLWTRGTPLAEAKTVFEAGVDDISALPRVFTGPYGTIALIERGLTFFTKEYLLVGGDGRTVKLSLPPGAVLQGATQGRLIITLRDAWQAFPQGSLIAVDPRGAAPAALLYAPDTHSTVHDVACGRDAVYAAIFENVVGTVHAFRPKGDSWGNRTLAMPKGGSTAIVAANDWGSEAQFTFESYLTPPTLYATDGASTPRAIKAQAPVFDASGMAADQAWATSTDGTRIPYFLIHAKNSKGPMPTILYSYGGFELALFPIYWNDGHRPLAASAWVGQGGAIAIANIRGGGEFGPAWHQAALLEHRQRAFDDFAAVARDLQKHGATTPGQLGIVGASNGGVLTTVTMTQHPELLAAVVSQRPLVDMLRYTRFGAGQSWVAEYGDPAIPRERALLEKYSAYQKVEKGVHYPSILFITETSDDRVTPIFARMMAAKMKDQGHEVLFNESSEGGHGPGATSAAQANMWGLTYAFFAQKLGLKYKSP